MSAIIHTLAMCLLLLPGWVFAQQEAQAAQDTLLLQSSITGHVKAIAPGRRLLVHSRSIGTVNGRLVSGGNTLVMTNTAGVRKEIQPAEIESIILRRPGWRVVSVLAIVGFYLMLGLMFFLILFWIFGLVFQGFFGATLLLMLGFLLLILVTTPLARHKFKMTSWQYRSRRPGS